MALTNPNVFSKRQILAYNQAALLTAYTYAQLVALMTFEQDEGTNEWMAQNPEIVGGDVIGLCEYGLFTPSIVAQGDEQVLADWRFTKVADPTVPEPGEAPSHTWVMPIPHQGKTPTAVAPGA